jgi:hypothetical protein
LRLAAASAGRDESVRAAAAHAAGDSAPRSAPRRPGPRPYHIVAADRVDRWTTAR